MRQILSLFVVLFPLMAAAQTYSNSPMLIVTPSEDSEVPAEKPAAPAKPAPATASTASEAAAVQPAAGGTEAPSKFWPKDTVPIFMTSCTKFHTERVDACGCIINSIMKQFGHDEFLKIDAANELQSNPRMQQIRQECVNEAVAANKRAAASQGK